MKKSEHIFGSLNDLKSHHDTSSISSIQDQNYFLSMPIQAYEQIEKMKILKAKYPAVKQSYQVWNKDNKIQCASVNKKARKPINSNHVTSSLQLQHTHSQHDFQKDGFDSSRTGQNDASSLSQTQMQLKTPFKRTSHELPSQEQTLYNTNKDSYRKSAINFNAIFKIEKGKLLPEIMEARQQQSFNKTINEDTGMRQSGMNAEDSVQEKSSFKVPKIPNLQNLSIINNFPRSLSTTYRLEKLLQNSERMETESSFFKQQYFSSSKIGRKTDRISRNQLSNTKRHLQPLSKQSIHDINENNLRNKLNYFSSDNMIYIKIPHISNFNIEPLEKYDEEQLYDQDFKALVMKGPVRGYSKWSDTSGNIQWKDCLVETFNSNRNTFGIQWISNGRRKEVTRINLLFENESQEKGDLRYQKAKEKREMMLFFLSMKNTIINNDMKENSQTNINVIQFPVERLQRILEQSLKWKIFTNDDEIRTSRDLVIEGVLELYKYNVIKFNYQFHTVQSMRHFYQRYLEDFATQKGKILFTKDEWTIEEFFCEQETNIEKAIIQNNTESDDENEIQSDNDSDDDEEELLDEIQNSEQMKRQSLLSQKKSLFYRVSTRKSTLSAVIRKRLKDEAIKQLIQKRKSNFEADLNEEELNKEIQKILNIKDEKEEEIDLKISCKYTSIQNKTYVDYICNKLGNQSIIYGRDKKCELFSIVVPMLAQFVTCLKDIKIYKGIQNIQLFYQQDAISAIKTLSKEFSRQSFKLERVIDKIEIALEELNKEFIKNLQNNYIEIENNPWRLKVQLQITRMQIQNLQSNNFQGKQFTLKLYNLNCE